MHKFMSRITLIFLSWRQSENPIGHQSLDVGPGALKLDFSSKSRFMALKCAKMLLHDSRGVFGDPYWHLDDGLSVFAVKMVISAMKRKTEP